MVFLLSIGGVDCNENAQEFRGDFPKTPELTSRSLFVGQRWTTYGDFLKWGYPKIIHFSRIFHYI